MKHKYPILITALITALFVVVFIIITYKNPIQPVPQGVTVSTEKRYYKQNGDGFGSGIPRDTVTDAHQSVNISWISASVVDGNDVCQLYDKQTRQIYFTKTQYGGLTPGPPPDDSYTYYQNNLIAASDAYELANKHCFNN